jgi:hypothetical protein
MLTPSSDSEQNSEPSVPGSTYKAHNMDIETLRRAMISFKLSVTMLVLASVLSFTTAGLVLTGRTTVEAVMVAESLISLVFHMNFKLLRETNRQLNQSNTSDAE